VGLLERHTFEADYDQEIMARSAITNPVRPFPPCCEQQELKIIFSGKEYGLPVATANVQCAVCGAMYLLEIAAHRCWLNLEITKLPAGRRTAEG